MKKNKPAWADEKHNWWNNPDLAVGDKEIVPMYEIIELASGRSHYFEHCQCEWCLKHFDIPAHTLKHFPGFKWSEYVYLREDIRRGAPASWYAGIYVRKVNV